jgi:hypothetical protein
MFFEDSHMDPTDTPRGSLGGKEFKTTLVVSAITQKSRFKDLEWSSVTVVSS